MGIYADLVLINGKIITVDKDDRIVEAIAIKRNKIEAIGKTDEIKNSQAQKPRPSISKEKQ